MSGDTFKVSAIIPVFNGESFLAEAVESILQQSRPPDEIIVVDDGSTDATAKVASAYADTIHYIRQDQRGPAAARNRGLMQADGDILGFLDADDMWVKDN